ncbi:MAG: hypothetical protein K0Q86_2235, partial [Arthrobacter koreensis]|nr:hypothetical protein [Arthrobacter koreensis]
DERREQREDSSIPNALAAAFPGGEFECESHGVHPR